jgi:hypothetical protein
MGTYRGRDLGSAERTATQPDRSSHQRGGRGEPPAGLKDLRAASCTSVVRCPCCLFFSRATPSLTVNLGHVAHAFRSTPEW